MLRLNLAYRFTYTQETIIDAISKNLIVKWIPVEVCYFDDRKSKVVKSVSKFVYQSFLIIIRTVRDARPMVFFGIPGVTLITTAAAIGIAFLGYYFSHFKVTPFRTWLSLAGISASYWPAAPRVRLDCRYDSQQPETHRRTDVFFEERKSTKNENSFYFSFLSSDLGRSGKSELTIWLKISRRLRR